jgi:hypothetical protein
VDRRLDAGERVLQGGATLVHGGAEQRTLTQRERVEDHQRRRGLRREPPHPRVGRVDALLQPLELQPPAHRDDQLAVEHAALRQRPADGLHDLGEVAGHRPLVAAGELDLVAVAEHDAAEAVPLGLVQEAALGPVRRGDALHRAREHRRHRGVHGKVHGPQPLVRV